MVIDAHWNLNTSYNINNQSMFVTPLMQSVNTDLLINRRLIIHLNTQAKYLSHQSITKQTHPIRHNPDNMSLMRESKLMCTRCQNVKYAFISVSHKSITVLSEMITKYEQQI